LADGRLPTEPGRLGNYEIELTPDEVVDLGYGGQTANPDPARRYFAAAVR
jgi:hypothetical protein